MHARRFFLFALIAAFLAVALHVGALSQFGRSAATRARWIRATESARSAIRDHERLHSTVGHTMMYSGAALAAASVIFLIISSRRHESAKRSVVFGLLVCYFVLQFVLV
jgi:hypothetical protein